MDETGEGRVLVELDASIAMESRIAVAIVLLTMTGEGGVEYGVADLRSGSP